MSTKHPHVFQLIQPNSSSLAQSILSTLPKNIFLMPLPEKIPESQLHNSKSYDLVGLRQLKAYKKRTKKRTKVAMRDREERLSDRTTFSRDSIKKKTKLDANLLNKEEVIESLPPLSKEQSSQILSKRIGCSVDTLSRIDPYKDSPFGIKSPRKEFSVERIKHRLWEQENQWQKLLRQPKEGEKFPTLGESIMAYVGKVQAARKTGIDDNLVNIKSRYWGNTLRKSCNINDICFPRNEIHTLHQGLKAKGNSKLIQETQWIEGKDQQGFKFKNYQQTNASLPSLRPIPR